MAISAGWFTYLVHVFWWIITVDNSIMVDSRMLT